jgi:hypothetical protein
MSATHSRSGADARTRGRRGPRRPGRRAPGSSSCRADAAASRTGRPPHEPFHALSAQALAVGQDELGVDARAAVDAAIDPVDLADPSRAAARLRRPAPTGGGPPRRESPSARPQARGTSWRSSARPSLPPRTRRSPPGPGVVLRKEGRAFFKISRSSARIRFSRRRDSPGPGAEEGVRLAPRGP